MVSTRRVRLAWQTNGRLFEAVEPDAALVRAHAAVLAGWYNAEANAQMMGGSGAMTEADVAEFWRELRDGGGRGFLGMADGDLVGDADLRGIRGSAAEFAIMIGDDAQKGRGLGRTLATMVHVFAFRELGLARLYVPPRRDNARVHALNAFLGYERDDGEVARSYSDDADAETYSLGAETFRAKHADAFREVAVEFEEVRR